MPFLLNAAHCVDEEFERRISTQFGVTIRDNGMAPWEWVFQGPREGLAAMYNDTFANDDPAEFIDADSALILDSTYRPALVTMPDVADEPVPCYTNGITWNGFGVPWFDMAGLAVLKRNSDAMDQIGAPVTLLIEGDVVRVYDMGEEEYFDCAMQVEIIKGKPVRMWLVGENWCWNQCMEVAAPVASEQP